MSNTTNTLESVTDVPRKPEMAFKYIEFTLKIEAASYQDLIDELTEFSDRLRWDHEKGTEHITSAMAGSRVKRSHKITPTFVK